MTLNPNFMETALQRMRINLLSHVKSHVFQDQCLMILLGRD